MHSAHSSHSHPFFAMAKLNFFSLLKELNADDVAGFHKYLKQIQGKQSVSVRVFEYYKKFHPDFSNQKKMAVEYATAKIFPRPLSEKRKQRPYLPNTFSDLFKLLKEYLILDSVRKDEKNAELIWLDTLYKRRIYSFFASQTDSIYAKITQESSILSEANQRYLGLLSALQFQNLALQTKSPPIQDMQQCLDALRTFQEMWLEKMECQLANARKVRPGAASEQLRTVALPTELRDIYQMMHQMILNEDEALFKEIEKLLIENIDRIDSEELQIILTPLRNFLSVKIRKDRDNLWVAKFHELNLFRLKYDPGNQKEKIQPQEFTNIVSVATRLNKVDWAESFVREYGPQLDEGSRDNNIRLANATILFTRNRFEQCLELLNQEEFRDFYERMRARTLVLRCNFELKIAPNDIHDYCHSFEAFLDRQRKIKKEPPLEATLEFVRICKAIVSMASTKKVLLKRIQEKPNLILSHWLENQVRKYRV